MNEAPPRRPSPVRRFFAALMMAVGALIAGLSGLCTGFVVIAGLASNGDRELIGMALAIGLAPIAIGIGLFAGGRALWRAK